MTEERTEAQSHYDRLGYYERQSIDAAHDSTYLAWAADMDNRLRHCRPGRNPETGERVRWLDNRTPEYIAARRSHSYDDDDAWQQCTADHSADPKVTGEIEWLAFIHTWLAEAPEGQRYFTEDGQLWIDPVGQLTSTGRRLYAETYFNRPPDRDDVNAQRGFSFRPVFRLFLANGEGYARIECYDPKLTELCERVWNIVQQSYETLHPSAQLTGGRVPEHVPGAYPRLSCCGGLVTVQ